MRWRATGRDALRPVWTTIWPNPSLSPDFPRCWCARYGLPARIAHPKVSLWNASSTEVSRMADGGGVLPPPSALQTHAIELVGVVENDLGRDAFGHAAEVLGDHFARVGPGRIGVREIGGPHVVVLAKGAIARGSGRIVLEGGPHLPAHVLRRLHFQRLFLVKSVEFLEGVIQPIHVMWQPSGIIFRRNDLQARKALQDAAGDDVGQRALHLVNQAHIAAHGDR